MKDFTAKYTTIDEHKILLRKISDLIARSEKTYSVEYSHFLTPAEQTLISKVEEFRGYIDFVGGFDDAERRLCRVRDNEYCNDEGLPIKLYSVISSNAEFTHRDILGSLMGLGIKREMIGDIIINEDKAQFFCHNSISEFVEFNLKKVGRYNAEIRESESYEVPVLKTQDISINVSSMRLDSISAECFGLSRTKSVEFITKGAVSLNWLVCTDTSKEVKAGDKISMRGKGKAEVVGISGKSRKGRLFVDVKKYI